MAPGTGKGLETVGEAASTIAEEGMDKAERVTGNRSLRRPGALFPRGRAVRIRWPEAGRRPGRRSGSGLERDGFRVRVARCLAFSPPMPRIDAALVGLAAPRASSSAWERCRAVCPGAAGPSSLRHLHDRGHASWPRASAVGHRERGSAAIRVRGGAGAVGRVLMMARQRDHEVRATRVVHDGDVAAVQARGPSGDRQA